MVYAACLFKNQRSAGFSFRNTIYFVLLTETGCGGRPASRRDRTKFRFSWNVGLSHLRGEIRLFLACSADWPSRAPSFCARKCALPNGCSKASVSASGVACWSERRFGVAAAGTNNPKSDLASPNHTANLSGLDLGCNEADFGNVNNCFCSIFNI